MTRAPFGVAIGLAALLAAPAARAEEPRRTCDAAADAKLVRALDADTERARGWLAKGGKDAEAEALLRDVVHRAGGAPKVRCFPPAEVALARAVEKKGPSDPATLRDAIALLVGVRELDASRFPPAWSAAVSDAGSRSDELVRRDLDAGRAKLDAKDFAGAEGIARSLRQLFVDVKGDAAPFAGATALLSRALWRQAGKRAEARRVGRELEALKTDGLDRATIDDVTEALEEQKVLPRVLVRIHAPGDAAVPATLDGEPIELGAPIRVDGPGEHRLVVDAPGYTRIDEAITVRGPEEAFDRSVREAIAPAPPGASAEDEKRFEAAAKAFDEQRWLDAAAALEAARPSPAKSFDLARIEEERGVPVRAWALYQDVLAVASPSPAWIAAHAKRHADLVAPAIARVRVDLAASRAIVTVDGQPVGPVTAGGERVFVPGVPQDPAGLSAPFQLLVERGKHTFVVFEPGHEPATSEAEVGETGIVALRGGEKSIPPTRRYIGMGATIAGGAAIVIGAGLGIGAINTLDDAKADGRLCPNKQCTPAGMDKVAAARGEAYGSTIAFAIGVPLAVAGLVVWSPWKGAGGGAPPAAAPKVGLAPLAGPGLGGLTLGGTFQ